MVDLDVDDVGVDVVDGDDVVVVVVGSSVVVVVTIIVGLAVVDLESLTG